MIDNNFDYSEFAPEMEFDPADYAEEIAAARLRAGLPVEAPAPAPAPAPAVPNQPAPALAAEFEQDADLINIACNSPLAVFAAAQAAAAQMPRNTVFLTTLAIFSGLCCRAFAVRYKDSFDVQPTSLYFCGEQPPATAKSRILGAAQKPARALIKDKKEALIKERARLQLACEQGSSSETIEQQICDLEKQIAALPRFITDTTPEALDAILADSNGFFTIASAEQAAINSLLGINYSDKKPSASNKDVVLKGYNGEWHDSARASRKGFSGQIVGSLCVIAQDGMINNIIEASSSSGAVERLILWLEAHMLGQRDFINVTPLNLDAVDEYAAAVERIFNKINLLSNFESLPALSISARGWQKINELRQQLEPTLANGGKNSTNILRGVIGKIDILIMKLAAVLHLSYPDAELVLIDDRRVIESIEIAKAYITHLQNLISDSAIETLSTQDQAVLKLLRDGAPLPTITIAHRLRRQKAFTVNGKSSVELVRTTAASLAARGYIVPAVIEGQEGYRLKRTAK